MSGGGNGGNRWNESITYTNTPCRDTITSSGSDTSGTGRSSVGDGGGGSGAGSSGNTSGDGDGKTEEVVVL